MKARARVALSLGLDDLHQRLVGHPPLGIVSRQWPARHVLRAEHQTVADVAVVGDGDDVQALLPLFLEVAPELFGILRVEGRKRLLGALVCEDHATVQVREVRRRSPLESHERRELSGLVVPFGDRLVPAPRGAKKRRVGEFGERLVDHERAANLPVCLGRDRGISARHDGVPLGLPERAIGIDRLAHRAQVLGVVGDREEVEGRDPLLRIAHVVDRFAHRIAIRVFRRGSGAEGERVHGVAGMQVQVSEVGVLERVRQPERRAPMPPRSLRLRGRRIRTAPAPPSAGRRRRAPGQRSSTAKCALSSALPPVPTTIPQAVLRVGFIRLRGSLVATFHDCKSDGEENDAEDNQ